MAEQLKPEGEQQKEKQGSKNGNSKLIVGMAAVIILLLVVIVIILLLRSCKKEEPEEVVQQTDNGPRAVVATEENMGSIENDLFAPVNPDGVPMEYIVTQNSDWMFPDGTSASTNAYVENDPANPTNVYFDLEISDTGEVIYESPVLEPGAHIQQFTLSKDLDPGVYGCIITYHLVDEEQNTLTTVQIGVNVIVEN